MNKNLAIYYHKHKKFSKYKQRKEIESAKRSRLYTFVGIIRSKHFFLEKVKSRGIKMLWKIRKQIVVRRKTHEICEFFLSQIILAIFSSYNFFFP